MFEVKIEGLERIQQELGEFADAVSALDGNLCDLRFDPHDKDSVRSAITQMETAVDARTAKWRGNPAVREIAREAKQRFREEILRKAHAAQQSGSE